eukprot:gene2814-1041_t
MSKIIPEMCEAIYGSLKDDYLKGVAAVLFLPIPEGVARPLALAPLVTLGMLATRDWSSKSPQVLVPSEKRHILRPPACKTGARNIYKPPDMVDREENGVLVEGRWRREMQSSSLVKVTKQGGNRPSIRAKEVQGELCKYFNYNGPVQ